MKKLLIMASIFPPQKKGGGPAISISNLAKQLKDRFDISILSQNHELGQKERLPGVIPCEWNMLEYGRVFYLDKDRHTIGDVLKKISEVEPDIIYQNSFFSYDQVLAVLKYKKHHDKNVRVIIAPRGELGPEKLKTFSFKKHIYILLLSLFGYLKNIVWQGASTEEVTDISTAIHGSQIWLAPNIACTYGTPDFNIKKTSGELSLVYIARIQEGKNLLPGIKYLKSINGRVTYDIYGPIQDKSYWKKCEKAIAELPGTIKVRYMGFLEHDDIAKTMAKYHALYLPTKGESFGQSIADSLLNARPVIISDMTPWQNLDSCAAGFDCPLNDGAAFTSAVQALVDMDDDEYRTYMRGAYDYISARIDTEDTIRKSAEMLDGAEGVQKEGV